MKRILTLLAVMMTVLSVMSCKKDNECKCVCDCGDNIENNGGPGNNGDNGDNIGPGDEFEVINSKLNYGYLENWGIYYEDQPSDINNWVVYLFENEYDDEGWSATGDVMMIELFSTGTDGLPAGKYTVEAFIENNYCNFSVGDGYVDEEEYCAGTWLFQDDYGVAAAVSGECNVKVNGNTYTITYDFSDDEYGIQFKGSYTGALDVYDHTTEGASLASVKSPAQKKIKKQASALRF